MGLIKATCAECGVLFEALEAERKRGWGRFCSTSCSTSFNRRGKRSNNWSGGKTHISSGHVTVYAPDDPHAGKNGYALEHRIVAARAIGRQLTDTEIVHHVNGDEADNRPENLQVMSQSEHMRLHNQLRREERSVSLGS